MRLALAAVALVVAVGPGWAEGMSSYALRSNHVGCSNPQDLIDFVRMGTQARGNEDLAALALRGLMAKVDNGSCHQFTQGTPVVVTQKAKVQEFDLECVKDERQDKCFYVLAPAS